MKTPILSIAIPTYNRAEWLKLCLDNLIPQLKEYSADVEVTVYDNASPDHTGEIVQLFLQPNLPLTYIRNKENIGSDRNIAQCFNNACGKYVLILGDDDVVVQGGLKKIIHLLKEPQFEHGVVYVKAYGYDDEFTSELPFQFYSATKIYWDIDKFMYRCGSGMAFISSLIINKERIKRINANQFINTALVQTYLFYESASVASTNLFVDEYLIAAKRIEKRDYDVTQVFASGLNDAFEYFMSKGLNRRTVNKINNKLIWYFFPFFIMQLRLNEHHNIHIIDDSYKTLKKLYGNNVLFWICLYPIIKLPKLLAKTWAVMCVLVSRFLTMEFGRLYIALKRRVRLIAAQFR